MGDPVERSAYIGNVGHNLIADTQLVIQRGKLHKLAPTPESAALADYTESVALGERGRALGVQLSCAVDAMSLGDVVDALAHLAAAAAIARRIDAARSEGITS